MQTGVADRSRSGQYGSDRITGDDDDFGCCCCGCCSVSIGVASDVFLAGGWRVRSLSVFSLLGIDGWYLAVDWFESTLELDPLVSTVVATVATTVQRTLSTLVLAWCTNQQRIV